MVLARVAKSSVSPPSNIPELIQRVRRIIESGGDHAKTSEAFLIWENAIVRYGWQLLEMASDADIQAIISPVIEKVPSPGGGGTLMRETKAA